MSKSSLRSALVVDDDVSIRKLLCDLLDELGIVARSASGGSEALSLVEDEVPDLILTDREMPGMSGLAFAAEIRRRLADTAPPIVLVSGSPCLGDDDLALFTAVVAKPFGLRTLVTAIDRCRQEIARRPRRVRSGSRLAAVRYGLHSARESDDSAEGSGG